MAGRMSVTRGIAMRDSLEHPPIHDEVLWRPAEERDDEVVAELCQGLYREDPGPWPGGHRNIGATLAALRREPWRGRAVVADVGGRLVGYALLVAFWSNDLGGELCEVDELYVAPGWRDRGYGAALFAAIEAGSVWPTPAVAIALGITPSNARARRLYERLGFSIAGVSMVKDLGEAAERSAPSTVAAGDRVTSASGSAKDRG